MASISPHKSGFRAQVFILGERDSKVFRTKREALAWAGARETEIRFKKKRPIGERYSIGDLLKKYLEDVVPRHKGHVREASSVKAIMAWLEQDKKIDTPVVDSGQVVSDYRDMRLKSVKGATVLREMKIFGSAFEEAKTEWKWITENPVRDLRKPPSSPHRERVHSWSDIRALLREMKYPRRKNATSLAYLLALRTGMREGEICGLTLGRISEKSISLLETKTNPRNVPLSAKARRIVRMILERTKAKNGADKVLGLKASTLSHLFIRYRNRAGLAGLTFHDSRHTAATWMAKKVDVLTLCKIFGWTDPKMAMVYYNPKASDIADML